MGKLRCRRVNQPSSPSQVEEIHHSVIEQFGGTLGVRDKGALESAIFHPQNVYFYDGGGLFDIAAACAFHIAEEQSFLDGNKRTVVGAALTFLEGNGISTASDSGPIYEAKVGIAEWRASKAELAAVVPKIFQP